MIDDRQLLVELRPRLRGMAWGLLSNNELRYVDDLAQEGWIAVWRARPTAPVTIIDCDELVSWCTVVARNAMRNWIRSEILAQKSGGPGESKVENKVVPTQMYGGAPELLELHDLATALWDGIELTVNAYHHGRVLEALASLPPRQREYVVERFWNCRSTTELHHGVFSPATWTQAKRNLRRDLADLIPAH
jgi:RNA polymerase sigma factor (sigma-70 family)